MFLVLSLLRLLADLHCCLLMATKYKRSAMTLRYSMLPQQRSSTTTAHEPLAALPKLLWHVTNEREVFYFNVLFMFC
jgi:hypothetical protein